MKVADLNLITFAPLVRDPDEPQATLDAIRKTMEQVRRDPALARELLLGTGMYTKSGKIKKKFR
jgi:hypothetical protein